MRRAGLPFDTESDASDWDDSGGFGSLGDFNQTDEFLETLKTDANASKPPTESGKKPPAQQAGKRPPFPAIERTVPSSFENGISVDPAVRAKPSQDKPEEPNSLRKAITRAFKRPRIVGASLAPPNDESERPAIADSVNGTPEAQAFTTEAKKASDYCKNARGGVDESVPLPGFVHPAA